MTNQSEGQSALINQSGNDRNGSNGLPVALGNHFLPGVSGGGSAGVEVVPLRVVPLVVVPLEVVPKVLVVLGDPPLLAMHEGCRLSPFSKQHRKV